MFIAPSLGQVDSEVLKFNPVNLDFTDTVCSPVTSRVASTLSFTQAGSGSYIGDAVVVCGGYGKQDTGHGKGAKEQ